MRKIIIMLILAILCLPIVAQPEKPEPTRVDAKVKQYIQWMNKESELWKASNRLVSLGSKAVPFIKLQIPRLAELPKVGCAKALIGLKENEYACDILLDILENGENATARRYSAMLLGSYGNLTYSARLIKILDNCTDPLVKISTAKTLWQLAKRTEATKILRDYLQSDKEDIRYTAAITLGEIGNVNEVKTILAEIKDEPTTRGQIAATILNQEKTILRYERMLKEQEEAMKSAEPAVPPEQSPPNPTDGAETLYPTIHEVLDKIQTCHIHGDKITKEMLVDAAIQAMASKADNYSEFWDEKEWEEFTKTMEHEEYVGIGIYVDKQEDSFVVSSIIYSGPAYRAGIRINDCIIAIDGWDTDDQNMEELVKRIKGPINSEIRLTIYRKGWPQNREIVVPRENVKLPHLFYQMLPGEIGYIYLTQFGLKAPEDVLNAMIEMENSGMKGLIIDLRDNHGGWLKAAVDIVDIFLPPDQLITYSQGRHPIHGRRNTYLSTTKNYQREYPLIILVNGSSASASEIVAGSLQCHKRAVIVGQQSYGKGSVQQPLELGTRPNTRLKLTVAMYYLPDNSCIHNEFDSNGKMIKRRGIMPDILAEKNTDYETWKSEEKTRLETAKVFQTYIEKYYPTNKILLGKLADNDQGSIEKYPDFQKWFESLNTRASTNDIRRWLRENLRRYVVDDQGREYACDYIEDEQLQCAIIELCKKLQLDPKIYPEYQSFSRKK